ncbi:MAG: sulfotransferase family 2 domain-containing protein [Bacteroidales bacterium]
MLISHKYKFIYTKTVKTGGTSIESYFEKYCMKEGEWEFSHAREEYVSEHGIIGYRGENKTGSKFYNHMPAKQIKDLIGKELWSNYFKFCVIRNPYDKLLSAFFHFEIKRNNIITSKDQLIYRFRNWIKTASAIVNDRNKYTIDGKLCVDDFIRTESILTDLEKICNRLDIPFIPSELPKLKSGFTPSDIVLQDYFDHEADKIVRNDFAFEFETFSYPFLYD